MFFLLSLDDCNSYCSQAVAENSSTKRHGNRPKKRSKTVTRFALNFTKKKIPTKRLNPKTSRTRDNSTRNLLTKLKMLTIIQISLCVRALYPRARQFVLCLLLVHCSMFSSTCTAAMICQFIYHKYNLLYLMCAAFSCKNIENRLNNIPYLNTTVLKAT